jgi:CspA family cold shock protein
MSNYNLRKIYLLPVLLLVISGFLGTSSTLAAPLDSFNDQAVNILLPGQTSTFFQTTIMEEGQESVRQTGVVKWFNAGRGYGYIQREDGSYLFVHYTNIRGSGYRKLEAGQNVEFEVKDTPKGPQAVDVVVIEEEALRHTGVVKWFNASRGYGYIRREDGSYFLVYYTDIRGSGYRKLEADQNVEFEVKDTPKGPQAVDVVVIEEEVLRHTGVVRWFVTTKGYGFIKGKDGSDYFVHYTDIRGSGYRTLKSGQNVEFEIIDGPKGPQAVDVVVVTP